jgi:hypothetical protein
LIPFDAAVLSRVHLAVEFPHFDKNGKRQLGGEFLSQIKSTAVAEDVRNWIESLSADKLNGRQVRNIFSAATTLARARGSALQVSDLEVLWDRADAFQDRMRNQLFMADQLNLPGNGL